MNELKRRNVLKVAALYVVAAWLVLQVADVVISVLELPSGTGRLVFILLVLGLPGVLLFSWFYEITPDGLKLEKDVERTESITADTGKRLTVLTTILLLLSLVAIGVNQLIERQLRDSGVANLPGEEPTLASETASPPRNSIAVLPFLDRSSSGGQEYLADGISEDILNLLAQIPGMHVIGRTSSFAFKGQSAGVQEIAQSLNVRHVLEGSVRASGENVRITTQLIDAQSGYHLWSEHYDRHMDDVHRLQVEVAAAVVKALNLTMLESPPSVDIDPEAYDLLLQARYLENKQTSEGSRQAVALLNNAIDIDPTYVEAIVELGSAKLRMAHRMVLSQREGYSTARRYFMSALDLEPNSVSASSGLAWVDLSEGDYLSAADRLTLVLSVDPTYLYAWRAAAVLLKYLGDYDAALEVEEYILRRDPIDAGTLNNYGFTLQALERHEEAEAVFRKLLGFRPDDPWTHRFLAESLLLQGDTQAALKEFEKSDQQSKFQGLAMAFHDLGAAEESDAALADLISISAREEPSAVAFVFAYRGEIDQAFEWFEKEYELTGAGSWFSEWKASPLLKNLRDDPRWREMYERVGMSESELLEIEFDVPLPATT